MKENGLIEKSIYPYQNYIFDLYGTLADVRTEESDQALWAAMAELYRRYGAELSGGALRERFQALEAAERARLAAELGTNYPEIRVERVFYRLLRAPADGDGPLTDPEGDDRARVELIANIFRALSNRWLRLYPGALECLDRLREAGKRVYLLSNAQRAYTAPEVRLLGLTDRFDAIYLSSDYGLCKPDPRFMQLLLDREGLDPAASVMIGNEPGCDLGVALRSGVRGILHNTDRLSPRTIRARLEDAVGVPAAAVEAFWRETLVIDDLSALLR